MTGTNNNSDINGNWQMALYAANFFIPFYGLRILLENYLMEDRLPIAYFMLLGLVSAMVTFVLTFVTKGKGLKTRILVTLALLVIIILLNVFIN